MALTVGKSYQLYTVNETILNIKVKILSIVSYEEALTKDYDINVLAINEKVISTTDDEQELEDIIGTDNIYYCRSTTKNSSGSYDYYVVWDGIIDSSKTVKINNTYNYTFSITLGEDAISTLDNIISNIKSYVSLNETDVTIDFTNKVDTDTDETVDLIDEYESKVAEAKVVLTALNKLSTTLIPAATKLSDTDLATTIQDINDNLLSIQKAISSISSVIT